MARAAENLGMIRWRKFVLCVHSLMLVGGLGLTWSTHAQPAASIDSVVSNNPEVDQYIEAAIEWSLSLETFAGTYRLERNRPNEPLERLSVEYKFNDSHEFMGIENTDTLNVEVFSLAGGVMDSMYITEGVDGYGVTDTPDRESLPFPWGVYITPQEIFGQYHDAHVSDVLSSGLSGIYSLDDKTVLYHINYDLRRSVDLWFDDAMNITRIEWMRRPTNVTKEQIDNESEYQIYELAIRKITLDLEDHTVIDGVSFPLRGQKTWWQPDVDAAQVANLRFRNGEIDTVEHAMEFYTILSSQRASQTFELNHASINQPLSAADFEIDFPSGMPVQSDAAWTEELVRNEAVGVHTWQGHLWQLASIGLVVAGLLGLCGAGFVLYRRSSPGRV